MKPKKLRKIKDYEFYSIMIILLYLIYIYLLLIGILSFLVLLFRDNFIITILGIIFVGIFGWIKINKLEEFIYK